MDLSKSFLKKFLTSIVFLYTFGYATVTVDGYAYLENQSDHSGITVTFERTAPSALTETATTDASGYFTAALETGIYNVAYTKEGYFSESLSDQSLYENTTLSSLTLLEHTTLINVPSLFSTIQSAIDVASNGDTILVQPGTYVENINFSSKDIVVGSLMLTTQDTSYISSTIIDGNQIGRVVTLSGGNTALLTGFTIQNGSDENGGGISCGGGTITNVTISNNYASNRGGGIYCTGSPSLVNVTISGNSAGNDGGGITCWSNSNPSLVNVTITNNTADENGGGIFSFNSNPSLVNVTISGNSSTRYSGGGIACTGGSPSLVNVTISGNSALGTGSYKGGGGISCEASNPSLVNVVITNNLTSDDGGGIYCFASSSPTIVNTIVSDNSGNKGVYVHSGNPSITYSNFYDNQNGNFYGLDWHGVNVMTNANGDSCDAYYNIQEDPEFVDIDNNNYHLQNWSQLIGAGTITDNMPETDIEGNPRPNPSGTNPDIGAYENPYGVPQYKPAVINVPADYSTIQAALTAAITTDTVLVQPGTYTENIIWPETNGIKLISAGDSSNTIIDGGGVSCVVYMSPQSATIDTTTLIKGFKIMNGGNVSHGGGIHINSSSPYIVNCWIEDNHSSDWAGGIYLKTSNSIIKHCLISNNYSAGQGGGIGFNNAWGKVLSCTIKNNIGNTWDGVGGAIWCYSDWSGEPIFRNLKIYENSGGIFFGGENNSLINSLIYNNHIAGVYDNGDSEITGCKIFNNYGPGYIKNGSSSTITNTLIANNQQASGHPSGGILVYNGELNSSASTIMNNDGNQVWVRISAVFDNINIISNNTATAFLIDNGNPSINQSNIISPASGLENLNISNYISATNNYWGDSSGPYHQTQNPNGEGSDVGSFIYFDPWLSTPNTDAPPIPTQNTSVTGTGNDFINLNWEASELGDLSGYKVYYDTDEGGYPYGNNVDVGNVTSHTLSGLTLGTTYYVAVTTVDTDGNESWYSNEVSGVTRVMQAQSLDIGGDEDLQHLITHTPTITFGYYDSMNETQTSYQVQVSTQSDYSSADMWDSDEITSSDTSVTYAGATLEDGATYYLRAKVGSGAFYSDWSTLTFRMNSTISMEDLSFDPDLGETSVYTEGFPTFSSSPTDSEGDSVFVYYMLSDTAGFSPLVDSALVYFDPSGADVSWQPTVDPLDNQQYWIKAKGYDGYEYGNESNTYSFMINSENDSPAAFTLTTPTDSSEVTTLTPLLDWSVSIDPDPLDTVKYTLYLDTPDPGVTTIDVDTVTSYQVSTSLNDNTTYYWKVVANDLNGASTENTGGYHNFRINTENDLPLDFALLSPENTSMVTDLTPTFHWEEPTDEDDRQSIGGGNVLSAHSRRGVVSNSTNTNTTRSIVSYNVYLDTSLTGTVPDTVSTNSYTAPTLLEDAMYYWKVVAVDNDGGTTESSTWSFWTNNANSSPATFTLLSPENSEVLTIFNPPLIWSSTIDADLNDQLSYSAELGTHIDSLSVVYTGSDTTFATSDLSENTTYYWQVTATDLSGATTENTGGYHSFRINTENDLPGNFALLSPDSGSMVTDLTPTFHWEVPADADDRRNRSIVSYYVYLDTSLTGTVPDTVSTNSYTASTLLEDAMYYWKVVAVDNDGGTTESSTWSFWTNNANSHPAAFTLLTPAADEETDLMPTFSWNMSSDADMYDSISYTLSYGSDPMELMDLTTGSDLTYTPDADLMDNTDYLWQVSATDQSGAAYTTALQSFTVNSANDNPEGLVLLNPVNESVITELPLVVVWTPVTDLDGDSIWYDVHLTLSREIVGTTMNNYFIIDSLVENQEYFIMVTANDNNGGYLESEEHVFNVDLENIAPEPFELVTPEAGEVLTSTTVTFVWEHASDSDPFNIITYFIYVESDTLSWDYEVTPILSEETILTPEESFPDNRIYHWSVTADDMHGGVTENIGGPRMFVINVENDAPTVASLVAPLDGSIQTDLTPNFYWTEANDPDPMDHVSYTMHWWPMGVLPVIYSANTDSNSFTPEENLTDNSQFGWMVTANDMHGAESNSDSSYFYTDAFPEPPLNFATVAPENEVEGIATEVEFIWNQTYDPDPLDEIHYQLVYAIDWEDSSTYVFSELIQDTSITLELEDNAQYYWMVIALDTDDFIVGSNDNTPNTMVVGTLSIDGADIPEVFALHQNYPNPFNPTTQIKYDLPEDALVSVTIYDIMGRSIRSLVNSKQTAGYRSIQWNATNNLGEPVSAGMYIYMIQAGEFRQVRKMVLLK
jgi:predicted outer membrane repeat protein